MLSGDRTAGKPSGSTLWIEDELGGSLYRTHEQDMGTIEPEKVG